MVLIVLIAIFIELLKHLYIDIYIKKELRNYGQNKFTITKHKQQLLVLNINLKLYLSYLAIRRQG